jgi:hypothetical protein
MKIQLVGDIVNAEPRLLSRVLRTMRQNPGRREDPVIARSHRRRSNLCRKQRLLRSARNDALTFMLLEFCPAILRKRLVFDRRGRAPIIVDSGFTGSGAIPEEWANRLDL